MIISIDNYFYACCQRSEILTPRSFLRYQQLTKKQHKRQKVLLVFGRRQYLSKFLLDSRPRTSQCSVRAVKIYKHQCALLVSVFCPVNMASNNVSNMDEEQALRECEAYVQTHNVQQILKDCIFQLCVSRPANPISFLREYFQKLERVSCFDLYLVVKRRNNSF